MKTDVVVKPFHARELEYDLDTVFAEAHILRELSRSILRSLASIIAITSMRT